MFFLGDNLDCYEVIHAPAGSTVRLTFTALNLEGTTQGTPTGQTPCGTTCNDPRGCDYISIYDGGDANAPLLGTFSGNPTVGPSVSSSGQDLAIYFHTDSGNCGISSVEDPGFFADWEFVEAGENICDPSAAVLRANHGVLHDDDPTDVVSQSEYTTGYGNNLDCGVRIRAGKGETVNFHFTEMNLEGGNTFHNGVRQDGSPQTCEDFGSQEEACDWVFVYDGRDASAPLLGTFTGDMTDAVAGPDSVTSTGRDLFVRFKTDVSNGGIPIGYGTRQGFFAEWAFIADGAECDHDFGIIRNTGLIGHNNEWLNL